MKCEKKKGWYCELFNCRCDGPNDRCSDFIQADVVSDSSPDSGSPLNAFAETDWRWYSEVPSLTEHGATTWIPSCWRRQTLPEARALLEDERFVASGIMSHPLMLVREEKTFSEVYRANAPC
jgi:hypothetical protein